MIEAGGAAGGESSSATRKATSSRSTASTTTSCRRSGLIETFEWEGMPGHVSFNTATFEEVDGKTRVTNRIVFQSVEDRDGMVASGMHEGMEEGFERFDELLAASPEPDGGISDERDRREDSS